MRQKRTSSANSSSRNNRNKRNQKSEEEKERGENPFGAPQYGEIPQADPGFTFYPPLDSPPVDPRDCELYPDSPWCGGNPLTTTPVGFEDNEITYNECGAMICTTPVAGFIKLPKRCVAYNSCPPTLPIPDTEDDIDLPIPDDIIMAGIPAGCDVFVLVHGYSHLSKQRVHEYANPNSQWWEANYSATRRIKIEGDIRLINNGTIIYPGFDAEFSIESFDHRSSSGNYFSNPPAPGESEYFHNYSKTTKGTLAASTSQGSYQRGGDLYGFYSYKGSPDGWKSYRKRENIRYYIKRTGVAGDATTYDFSSQTRISKAIVIPLCGLPPREFHPDPGMIFTPQNNPCKPQKCCS